MANQTSLKTNYSFVKGLATEASLLSGPDDHCSSMSNVVLGQDGSLSSRPGIEEHTADFDVAGSQDGSVVAMAEIRGLDGGDPDDRYLAVYAGGTSLVIFKTTNLSSITKEAEHALFSSAPSRVSVTAVKGYFIVASDTTRPVRVGLSSFETLTLQERDFEGVDDGLQVNQRPTTSLSSEHLYNLRNQGWPPRWINAVRYPSNADVPWTGITTDPGTGLESFSKAQILQVSFGNTPAPRGAVVLDPFDTTVPGITVDDIFLSTMTYDNGTTTLTFTILGDYTYVYAAGDTITLAGTAYTYTNLVPETVNDNANGSYTIETISYNSTTRYTTFTVNYSVLNYSADFTAVTLGFVDNGLSLLSHPDPEIETSHPVATASWAGRAWYGGVTPAVRTTLRGAVFFSQVANTVSKLELCHSENDPTARDNNEVIATDGGRVTIADMGTVYQMLPMGNNMLLFADNGVWSITGRDGIFDPTNYSVSRISDRGVSSNMAAVNADGIVLYYSNAAVHIVETDELGNARSKPMSDHIDSYFTGLVDRDDARVRLSYDKKNKQVRILFGKDISVSQDIDELVFDMRLGAFYPLELTGYAEDDGSYGGILAAWCPSHNYTNTISTLYLALKSDPVTGSSLIFLTMSDTDAVTDTWSGESFEAYATTLPTPLDAALIEKQMPRVGVYMERNANAGLKMQGRFSWSVSGDSGKWGTKQECYLERGASFEACWRTLTVRGSGKAVQLHFTNEGLKPFKLLGWDIKYTGNPE